MSSIVSPEDLNPGDVATVVKWVNHPEAVGYTVLIDSNKDMKMWTDKGFKVNVIDARFLHHCRVKKLN